MRLAIPGDEVATSQYLPEKSTSEYRVPSIHQVDYIPQAPEQFGGQDNYEMDEPMYPPGGNRDNALIPPRKPHKKVPTEKDPFYRCNGVNVFIHYVKQFPSQNSIKVGATILEENSVVRIGHGQQECNWASFPVDASKVLKAKWKNTAEVQPDGAPIIDRTKLEEDQYLVGQKQMGYNRDSEDILIPINNEVSWEHDFYKLLWDKNLRDDVFLIVTLLEASIGLDRRVHPSSHEYITVGYGTIKLNNLDGTIRYGTFDIPLYHPPAKIRNHDPDKLMKSSIKITVSQPLPSMPRLEPYKNDPLKPVPGPAPDMPMVAPPPNRPPEDSPFIPNDRDQYNDEPFNNKEGIDIYVDGGRFFPENTSYTRVIVHGFTIKGKQFMKPIVIQPDIVASNSREPFYAYRGEIRVNRMDPTSILVFTMDTFDLSKGHTVIVGHACMPLFIDDRTKSPCLDPKVSNYILQNGDYQIPIYMEFVKDMKRITFQSFEKLEKIPAASLLIRIRKAPKDEKGKILTLGTDVDIERAQSLGMIEIPKQYSEGSYNTTYCDMSSTESIIMEAKLKRNAPVNREILEALIQHNSGEDSKMTDEDIKNYVERNFLSSPIKNLSDLHRFEYLN